MIVGDGELARASSLERKEIMAVLKLYGVQGVQACSLGMPILAEAIAASAAPEARP